MTKEDDDKKKSSPSENPWTKNDPVLTTYVDNMRKEHGKGKK